MKVTVTTIIVRKIPKNLKEERGPKTWKRIETPINGISEISKNI